MINLSCSSRETAAHITVFHYFHHDVSSRLRAVARWKQAMLGTTSSFFLSPQFATLQLNFNFLNSQLQVRNDISGFFIRNFVIFEAYNRKSATTKFLKSATASPPRVEKIEKTWVEKVKAVNTSKKDIADYRLESES